MGIQADIRKQIRIKLRRSPHLYEGQGYRYDGKSIDEIAEHLVDRAIEVIEAAGYTADVKAEPGHNKKEIYYRNFLISKYSQYNWISDNRTISKICSEIRGGTDFWDKLSYAREIADAAEEELRG